MQPIGSETVGREPGIDKREPEPPWRGRRRSGRFRNEPGQPASMLILFTPGAPRESFFEELAEITASGREPSEEEMILFDHENRLRLIEGDPPLTVEDFLEQKSRT